MPSGVMNVLTVDVEEYFQVEAFSEYIEKKDWDKYPRRVDEPTFRLLDMMAFHRVKGTFFVLGWLAERNPTLIKKIHEAGHEIASHGYGHTMVTKLTPEEFRKDIRRSKCILEKITNSKIRGYRAPTFSIVRQTAWAYGILLEEGFEYSSSVFPIQHDRYGWPGFGIVPRVMESGKGTEIWEIPMSTGYLGPFRIPFAGGGYLRTYPLFLTKCFFDQHKKRGESIIMYIHPWELDGQHPTINAPLIRRLRHFYGIPSVSGKLERLLAMGSFDTMEKHVNGLKKRRDVPVGQ